MATMPGRNIYKNYVPDSFYHIYNRGVNRQVIFRDNADYSVFLSLFKRYLGKYSSKDSTGALYPSFINDLELLAFCLMPSHFHLLIYQHTKDAMQFFLKSLATSYSMYFNKKYKRLG